MPTRCFMRHILKYRLFLSLVIFLIASSLIVTFESTAKAEALGGNGPLNIPVPVTSWAERPQEDGGWAITADGGVFTYGNAQGLGAGNSYIRNTVSAAFSSPSGNGYTMITDDGGVFTFGDAQAYGAGNAYIRNTVAAAFPSKSGHGYTMITDDGGVFTFGDAQAWGAGNAYIRNQVTTSFPTHTGNGYWMITDDGGAFTFGDAQGLGTSNSCRTSFIVAGASSTSSMKYWTISSQGELREFPNSGITCIAPTISAGPCAQNNLPQRVYISIREQHLWACEWGMQVFSTPVTTGAISKGHGSPIGTFKVYSKQTDRYLSGSNYRAHVDYWMPFLRGYGMHDASWRRVFGIQSFVNDGSHGCINMPKASARWMYGWSRVGTTVTLY